MVLVEVNFLLYMLNEALLHTSVMVQVGGVPAEVLMY
jgi:hypothetical protein